MSPKIPNLHLASEVLHQFAVQSQRRREKRQEPVQLKTVIVSLSYKRESFDISFSLCNFFVDISQTDSIQPAGNMDSQIIMLPHIPPNIRLVKGRVMRTGYTVFSASQSHGGREIALEDGAEY